VGGFYTQNIDGHVERALMDASSTTAQLMLDPHPAGTLANRQSQFLRYPVKGRSLSQLQEDYEGLLDGQEAVGRERLEEAYLVGWANHEPDKMLDWVSANVGTEQQRLVLYHGVLAQQGAVMVNQMLGNPQHSDYPVMMMAVANMMRLSNSKLHQVEHFFTTNQSKPASLKLLQRVASSLTETEVSERLLDRYYKTLNLSYNETAVVHISRGLMTGGKPLNVAFPATDTSNALVIPRP